MFPPIPDFPNVEWMCRNYSLLRKDTINEGHTQYIYTKTCISICTEDIFTHNQTIVSTGGSWTQINGSTVTNRLCGKKHGFCIGFYITINTGQV